MKASRLVNRKTQSAQRDQRAITTSASVNLFTPPIAKSAPIINTKPRTTSSGDDQICNICAQLVPGPERDKIFGFGKCDHYVCYVCSARLRVICEQPECPICREKLEYVLFSTSKAQPFDKHNLSNYILDEKYKIYFENNSVKESFDKLLIFECQLCSKQVNSSNLQATKNVNNNNNNNSGNKLTKNNNKIEEDAQGLLESSTQINETKFNDVFGLKNHLNYIHNLKLCDLCLTHNKLFPFEYSYYDKQSLKKHTENGEPKTSHRGHPNCRLCHQIFFNAEELVLHMSREHYHCHLCARHDSNMRVYFLDYVTLREHFKTKHLLCEKDNCKKEAFLSVFDNEIDFHMHQVSHHPTAANLSRGEARHQRTITLEQPSYSSSSSNRDRGNGNANMQSGHLPANIAIVSTPIATANSVNQQRAPESIMAQIRQQRMPTRAEFPALGQSSMTFNEMNFSSQAVTIANTNPFPSLPTTFAANNNTTTNNSGTNTSNSNGNQTRTASTSMRHRVTAGPSTGASKNTFVRSMGLGSRPPEKLDEMDFPPLPEQPKTKSNKKPKSRPKNDKPLSLEQMIGTSLNISNSKTNKSTNKKTSTKGSSKSGKMKIQL